MTKAQRFITKARELVSEEEDLWRVNPDIDSYIELEQVTLLKSKYLHGMAVVIIALIRQQENTHD